MTEYTPPPRPWLLHPTNAGLGLEDANGKMICHEWDIGDEDAAFLISCFNAMTEHTPAERDRLERVNAELLAACRATTTLFRPRDGLPADIARQFRQLVEKDPVLKQVRAAIALATNRSPNNARKRNNQDPPHQRHHLA